MKNLLSFLLLLLIVLPAFSQSNPKTEAEEKLPIKLKLMALNRGHEVTLRWAFSEPEAWRYLAAQGYWLERFELDDETNELKDTNPVIISGSVIKPWTEAEFEARLTSRDTFVAIAGQCLYGDDELPLENGSNMFRQLELKAKSEENRLLFAMMAASFDPVAAQSMGWGYVDKDIRPGLKYIYRLRVDDAPNQRFITDTSYYIVATNEVFPPEIPMTPMLEMGDSIALLEWYRSPVFIAYHIERSEDGITWQRLNQKPFLNMGSGKNEDGNKVVYSDQLPMNFKEYMYRIKGITIFGEDSPASDVVTGSGRDLTPTAAPRVMYAENTEGINVELRWEITNAPDLTGFLIKRSYSMEGPWESLTETPLPSSAREYVDTEAEEFGLNFYRVFSLDDHNNENGSYPVYVKMNNQAPPAVPFGLKGTIDTTGLLTIHWNANKEPDLMGYEVYYTNQDDHEYIVINDSILTDTFFTTIITLKTLTKHIYFKVRALDVHHSMSAFSEVLKLTKPDLVPPTRPIFRDFLVDEKGIFLEWAESSSSDLAEYRLERSEDKSQWETLIKMPAGSNKYNDSAVRPGVRYTYRIIAIDDSGLESQEPHQIEVQAAKIRNRADIENLQARILEENNGVILNWQYSEKPDLVEFLVYQVLDNGSLRQLGKVQGAEKSYTDTQVAKSGKSIRYGVKAVHKEGGSSNLAKTELVSLN